MLWLNKQMRLFYEYGKHKKELKEEEKEKAWKENESGSQEHNVLYTLLNLGSNVNTTTYHMCDSRQFI